MTQYTCSKRAVDLWERVFGEETLFSRYYNQQISGQGRTDILKYFAYAVFKSLFNSITVEFQTGTCSTV